MERAYFTIIIGNIIVDPHGVNSILVKINNIIL